jgi:hypothetical protein
MRAWGLLPRLAALLSEVLGRKGSWWRRLSLGCLCLALIGGLAGMFTPAAPSSVPGQACLDKTGLRAYLKQNGYQKGPFLDTDPMLVIPGEPPKETYHKLIGSQVIQVLIRQGLKVSLTVFDKDAPLPPYEALTPQVHRLRIQKALHIMQDIPDLDRMLQIICRGQINLEMVRQRTGLSCKNWSKAGPGLMPGSIFIRAPMM